MLTAIDHGYLSSGKYIFNHDIMHYSMDYATGTHHYSARALGITEPWDNIQLAPELKPFWSDIIAHYRRIGLSHTQKVIWDLSLKHLTRDTAYQPSVFCYGFNEYESCLDNKWFTTVDYFNSKNNLITLAKELEILVPETKCFESIREIKPELLENIAYPCFFKTAVFMPGIKLFHCKNKKELIQVLENFSPDIPVQIQEDIKAEAIINLQYQVIGDSVKRFSANEKILDGFSYQGIRVPARHKPWTVLDTLAYWMKEMGMKGIFSFDLAVVQTKYGLRFPLIECKPRFSGATYPTLIAQKLDIPEWSTKKFSTRFKHLKDIELRDVEFNKQTGEGFIIVNWGTLLQGELSIMMAGSEEYQQALAGELEARL